MRCLLIASLAASAGLFPAHALLAQTDDPVQASTAMALPVTARGNEPFWTVTLAEGRMQFTPLDGAAIGAALPAPEAVEGGAARYAAADLVVTLAPGVCRDSMTGMPHPLTATVETGGRSLQGCAGVPVDLLAGDEWTVTEIGGDAVPDSATVTIAFDAEKASAAGASGCNRYFSGFDLTGEGLSFKAGIGGTMMACEDDKMALERRFLDALPTVSRFDIDAEGALVLFAADTPVLRARR